MGIAERREREKEALRTRMVEAARDILSDEGVNALSMRSLAERIEYSPATIYLYFRDKNELLGEVIHAGFQLMGEYIESEMTRLGPAANPAQQHRALGRAYARFGLENTAYFRVMFELPTVPQAHLKEECRSANGAEPGERILVETVQRAVDAGLYQMQDAETGALVAWGLIHGLTSLYLSGHLSKDVDGQESFMELVEAAMDTLGSGWVPREAGGAVQSGS
jgi:AcrR family transcriptional regulator